METFASIRSRRSIRKYRARGLTRAEIARLLEAARWAPSGLNNQPWRFLILEGGLKDGLARFTRYSYVIKHAPVAIAVFLDRRESYDRKKDLMAVGACIENMLLCGCELGLGSCWLGEILGKRRQVERFLGTARGLELCAVVVFGRPAKKAGKGSRKALSRLMASRA